MRLDRPRLASTTNRVTGPGMPSVSTLAGIYQNLRAYCASRGFELLLSNLHASTAGLYDEAKWLEGPLEAQGGEHALSANCIAEITRQSAKAYLVPVLSLGNSLGAPLIPLTIESQDFEAALKTAHDSGKAEGKALLEKWYKLDSKAQPPCYRLQATVEGESPENRPAELKDILSLFVEIFSKDLKNSYLTSVVELEIQHTILMSQELARRCVWLRTANPSDTEDATDGLVEESTRRLNNLVNELKKILNDKNVLRIDNGKLPDVAVPLENNIKSHIDVIIEEHLLKTSLPNCTHGIDKRLYGELDAVAKLSQIFSQNCSTSHAFDQIKKYIQNPSQHPLVIHGQWGAGKTVLMAKLAQTVHEWLPDCCLAIRYGGLSACSQDIPSVLDSIVQQIGHIQSRAIPMQPHTTKSYGASLKSLIQDTELPIVIVVDSLEALTTASDDLDWVPGDLPANIKVIITITETDEGMKILDSLKAKISSAENVIHLSPYSEGQWKEVVSRGTISLPEQWMDAKEKTPIHAKYLSWMAWLGVCPEGHNASSVEALANTVLDVLERKLGKECVAQVLALILVRPFGVLESEVIDQLLVKSSPEEAGQLWLHLCWIIGPLLLHTSSVSLVDKALAAVAKQRYPAELSTALKATQAYYEAQPKHFVDAGKKYQEANGRKFALLPLVSSLADEKSFKCSPFVTDLDWITEKIAVCGAGSLLADLRQFQGDVHVDVLVKLCVNEYVALNYDVQQFYSLLKDLLAEVKTGNAAIENWREKLSAMDCLSLEEIPIHDDDQVEGEAASVQYDKIVALKNVENGYFVVSISTARAELIVWDVARCKKVRTLTKVPQPTDLCPVGDFGVAVLCGREIKVLDLNDGCFKVTLKGVMNHKMPYFGLHDAGHLVCLSRNRMYVNLMNLESGDCVTTFKAGEDRFLNSLLVAGDGRILVCGDETQKPFPLLVWHLTQRKLLYDLRIPHHDFITSLSAITYEGSYVCVVAKELDEPSPNFIVVYDLQSGTLFKKWKPACDTVSLAISQTQTCVIAGLEDARILVWDLVTGNCKLKLLGHNAPVTRLKLDPSGKILLSGDSNNQDPSIRLWDLSTGNQLAVYTPPAKITTCEILNEGRFIVLALENRSHLLTLELKPLNAPRHQNITAVSYGKEENEGKVFEI